jgi:DNA-binding CsgD family transcriptional regulator
MLVVTRVQPNPATELTCDGLRQSRWWFSSHENSWKLRKEGMPDAWEAPERPRPSAPGKDQVRRGIWTDGPRDRAEPFGHYLGDTAAKGLGPASPSGRLFPSRISGGWVVAGQVGPGASATINAVTPVQPGAPLTPTEIEVVRLLARGESSFEVGRQLQLKPGVVREAIQSILEKMQAHSRIEAVALAGNLGLLD